MMIATQTKYEINDAPIDSIQPSPENDSIYGEICHDDDMDRLIESIQEHDLAQPLIVSADGYIISGHRRYFACCHLGWHSVPIQRKTFSRQDRLEEWPKILADHNPQRVKGAASVLKEALMRYADEDASRLLRDHNESAVETDASYELVFRSKKVQPISDKKAEFLAAAAKVVNDLKPYWPLTIRQVHYNLLNNPPMITTPKASKFCAEKYRYRNDKRSYRALVELLTPARHLGHIDDRAIDDPTRPTLRHYGFEHLSHYVNEEMRRLLTGYHRDRQLDQPRHVEVMVEKNTVLGLAKPICAEYYVTLCAARGYASYPLWRDMASRFRGSGKTAMTLIIASDHDPEGLDLAKDAIGTLRDLWGIDLDYHRVGVTHEQVLDLDLAEDFNPAKPESSRYRSYVSELGNDATWELEALPPAYFQEQLRTAIEANMDMDAYRRTLADEQNDAQELKRLRAEIVRSIGFSKI